MQSSPLAHWTFAPHTSVQKPAEHSWPVTQSLLVAHESCGTWLCVAGVDPVGTTALEVGAAEVGVADMPFGAQKFPTLLRLQVLPAEQSASL
jgi:hypothetical protein